MCMTTFSLSGSGSQIYFVKDNNSTVAISDADFFNREPDIGFNLDSNTILGPGAQEISISPKAYLDKLNVIQKSPSVVKLSDGSVAVDFTGNAMRQSEDDFESRCSTFSVQRHRSVARLHK